MFWQFIAEKTRLVAVLLPGGTVATAALEDLEATGSADKADECGTENNQRKEDSKEEDADECRRSEQAQRVVLQRAFADANHRFRQRLQALPPLVQRTMRR